MSRRSLRGYNFRKVWHNMGLDSFFSSTPVAEEQVVAAPVTKDEFDLVGTPSNMPSANP